MQQFKENLSAFFGSTYDTLEGWVNFLMQSKYYLILVPFFMFFLGFAEFIGFIGYFIPSTILIVTIFALFVGNMELFFIAAVFYTLGVFFGLIGGYFIGKFLFNRFINKIQEKYKSINDYFKTIEEYIDKYHFWAFPFLVNIGFISPIVGIYFGANSYKFRKYLLGILLGTISYCIPRIFLGYLVGIFGKIIFDYLKIGYKYIIYVTIGLLIISTIADIFIGEKKLEGKK